MAILYEIITEYYSRKMAHLIFLVSTTRLVRRTVCDCGHLGNRSALF